MLRWAPRILHGLKLMLCILAPLPAFSDAPEKLIFKPRLEHSFYFQIQNAQDAAYELQIHPFSDDSVVIDRLAFQKSKGLHNVLESNWKHSLQDGLYAYTLLRNGQKIKSSTNRVALLSDMDTKMAQIDRRKDSLMFPFHGYTLMRANAGLQTGMYLTTLQPWQFVSPGEIRMQWDFFDTSEVHNYRYETALIVYAQEYRVQPEFLLIGSLLWSECADQLELPENLILPQRNIQFDLSINGTSAKVAEVGKKTPIRVKLSPETHKWLTRDRFEILIYLDGAFLHEESQGVDPYTYIFPDVEWAEGEHVLTVNVLDYNGNFGSVSRKIKI